jgi:hypothetical protein
MRPLTLLVTCTLAVVIGGASFSLYYAYFMMGSVAKFSDSRAPLILDDQTILALSYYRRGLRKLT